MSQDQHPGQQQPSDPSPNQQQQPMQQPKIEIHQAPAQQPESSNKGCFSGMMMIAGLVIVLVLGILLLNTLGGISNELGNQTDAMQQQNSILIEIQNTLKELVDAVKNIGQQQ
ncbi:hypothetical protein GCM10011571_05660 [Marinithermofilum abyssi]|uniref:Uncharacterized protein n=1 Tax=Marinithermofilum abyssi TaxID=1571185 RepID=A0A8J2VBL4_9BACL|nr:hypothetical protein [Marinithermofilum abyssi]GGE07288.1 hypothetical protein GCM10011571_05660 [Marinithermofilum abyssi]